MTLWMMLPMLLLLLLSSCERRRNDLRFRQRIPSLISCFLCILAVLLASLLLLRVARVVLVFLRVVRVRVTMLGVIVRPMCAAGRRADGDARRRSRRVGVRCSRRSRRARS